MTPTEKKKAIGRRRSPPKKGNRASTREDYEKKRKKKDRGPPIEICKKDSKGGSTNHGASWQRAAAHGAGKKWSPLEERSDTQPRITTSECRLPLEQSLRRRRGKACR